MQVSTGNVISAMNASDENINAVLCGADRLESYRNQLKTNPEIAVVETKRDPDGVSGTKLRKALMEGDKKEFERNADPATYKFYDKLRSEIKGSVKERFMGFESFSKIFESIPDMGMLISIVMKNRTKKFFLVKHCSTSLLQP